MSKSQGNNFWDGLHEFERLQDRDMGRLTSSAEKVLQLWGPVRLQELLPDRPLVMTNFVSTIDGVASYGIPGYAGGGTISKSAADRWIMDVWRTHADAILLGAETIRDADAEVKKGVREGKIDVVIDGQRINGFVDTVEDPELIAWRTSHKRSRHPLLVVFSGSGDLPADLGIFELKNQSIIIFTTPKGAEKLKVMTLGGIDKDHDTRVVPFTGEHGDMPRFALDYLRRERNVNYLLVEGGPGTIGTFLATGLLDEIILTVAPRAGYGKDSKGNPRKRIFEGNMNFYPKDALADSSVPKPSGVQSAPEFELVSVRRYDSHLFLRYWRK